MFKNNRLIKSLCTVFCLITTTVANAQSQSSYTGTTLEDAGNNSKEVYLYNVGAHKFLYPGNTNGTMASLLYDDLGAPLKIGNGADEYSEIDTDDNGDIAYDDEGNFIYKNTLLYRKITTPIFTTGKNALGIGTDGSFYLDRDDDSGNLWQIEKTDDANSNFYTFRLFDKNDNKYYILRAEPDDGNITKVASVAQSSPFTLTRLAEDLNLGKSGKDATYTIDGTEYSLNASAEEAEGSLDESGHYLTGLSYFDDEISWDDSYNYPNLAGKYDITVTYIPTAGANSLGIDILATNDDDERFIHNYDVDASGDDTGLNNAKTLHFSFYLHTAWATLSVKIYGAVDQVDENGDPTSYKAMPNIVSYSISLDPGQPTDNSDAKWLIVPKDEIAKILTDENTKQYGTDEGKADATFLMNDQGFTNGDVYNWDTEGASVTKSPTDDANAMYTNARITGTGDVYQDIEVPNTGVYQFDAYGFYKGSRTYMYYQYWKNDSWSDVQGTQDLKTFADNSLANDKAAGEEFYKESVLGTSASTYKNTLMVYVPGSAKVGSNYKIRIGFHKTADASDDYTAVDDIHLHYKGQSAFVLDGSWSEAEMEKAISGINAEQRSDVHVYIKRKLWKDAWNPVVLPVDVPNSNVSAIFGSSVQVATPYGLVPNATMRFELLKNQSDGLKAGNYYIIYTSDAPTGITKLPYFQMVSKDGKEVYEQKGQVALTDGNEYFDLGTVDLSSTSLSTSVDPMTGTSQNANGDTFHEQVVDGGDKVSVIGGYANFDMPGGSYALTNKNNFRHYKSAQTMGAFKFYVSDNDGSQSSSSAKQSLGFFVDNGNTTGINTINVINDGNIRPFDGSVFNLSGERVGVNGNTDSLPAGIYISNGRKFIKK